MKKQRTVFWACDQGKHSKCKGLTLMNVVGDGEVTPIAGNVTVNAHPAMRCECDCHGT